MRITLLTDGMSPYVLGGMQRHSSMLAQYLIKEGVHLDVYHTAHNQHRIEQARKLEDFPCCGDHKLVNLFVDYPQKGRFPGHYLKDSLRFSRRLLAEFVRRNAPCDFIYAQGLTGLAFVEAKANGQNLPPIGINVHGYEMFQRTAEVRQQLESVILRPTFRRLNQKSDFVITFPGKIKEIVLQELKVPSERIIELTNAVGLDWLLSTVPFQEKARSKFMFIGRYERRKGIEELNRAILHLVDEEMEYHFVGPLPRDKRLAQSNVFYHGKISNPDKLKSMLDSCDVLVCPSYSEGMPTVILEAMARGLAIVATDVGAVNAMVGNDNGILLPGPEPVGLRNALERMSSLDAAELHRMKQASLTKVAAFTWDKVAKDTIEAIQKRIKPH